MFNSPTSSSRAPYVRVEPYRKARSPAWPMRRPGGAVSPAMNDTTGLVVPHACKRDAPAL
eukprot:1195427-Prorocentrum_minimum.AAC.2